MLIFPLIYITAFISAIKVILKKDAQGGLLFIIFGLCIYNTTFSIIYDAGYKGLIPLLQPCKEVVVLAMLLTVAFQVKEKVRFHLIDYCVVGYLAYTALYVLLPIGEFGFVERMLAYKSTSFFGFIYLTGRLINVYTLEVKKYFHFILVVAVFAAQLVLYEFISDQHFQTLTGYADYTFDFFGQVAEGNYGLTWTFERSESGAKRFASFFSDPLEHASATLLSLSVIAALSTRDDNRLQPGKLAMIAFLASMISVTFSISRSAIASYFVVIYVYALITRRKYILHACHALIALAALYIGILLADTDIYDYILSTITLQDASAVGHVVEWITGIEAMISNPLGMGLGTSGRVAVSQGTTIGGENQFIILGVQVGILAVLMYLFVHVAIIYYVYKWFPYLKGRERMVALCIFLLKIGITLPLLTSNLDSYSYITYINWFFSGVFVNMIMRKGNQMPESLLSG